MKHLLFIIPFYILFVSSAFAQDNSSISISFNNESLENAMGKLETASNKSFYFEKAWLADKKAKGEFKNKPLSFILDELFNATTLNYFIKENRVSS